MTGVVLILGSAFIEYILLFYKLYFSVKVFILKRRIEKGKEKRLSGIRKARRAGDGFGGIVPERANRRRNGILVVPEPQTEGPSRAFELLK